MLRRENGKAWPSLRKMERATGLARGTVCKAIRNLEKNCFIAREEIRKGKHNLYTIIQPKEEGKAGK